MNNEKTSNTPAVIDADVDNSASASKTITTQEQPNSQSKKSSQMSAQVQLLNLAKLFALDGSLKPADKQMPIEDRSGRRVRISHLRRQQNMEKIVEKSIHYCAGDQVADRTDADWFDSFIELAERVSNPAMQELWAKILAGEISQPGSFSLKALQAFKNMSLHEAKLFGKACALAVSDSNKKNIRIITGCYQQPGLLNLFDSKREQHVGLSQFGFNYGDVLTLAEHHLVFTQETELETSSSGGVLNLKYNGLPLAIKAKKKRCALTCYKLTPIGAELAQLIADKPDNQFLEHLKAQLSHHYSFG
ncbi:TIGR03899 family protein [Thalassotalea euphylliae]|uniref:TIGR03899 family protein n=1 Tax=Thalassotalea euphylliae TaxID=1655234 RepID=A0A3E0U2F9_9GAMM|nr:TIGR03899 family protein [Thalassotalea euphylliae]REL30904.1 TIGR03899 family protein [Thalassotalea euphylliae]